MKKTKIVALVLACVMLCAVLASCGKKLSGKYQAGSGLASVSYEFKGSKVTVSYAVLGMVKSFEGKYSIDGDKITFTFNAEDNVESKYTGTQTFEQGKDDDGKQYIKVGGLKYTKQ